MNFTEGIGFLSLLLTIWLVLTGLSAFFSIDGRDDARGKDE
jgi:hypothetical protein